MAIATAPTDTREAPARSLLDRLGPNRARTLRRLFIAFVLIAGWQAYVTFGDVSPLLVPSPLTVLDTLVDKIGDGTIPRATGFTMRTLVLGSLIGMGLGMVLAALAVVSKLGRDFLGVLVSVFNPLPSVAILPLAMIWFGITPTAIVFVVVNSSLWPVAINTDMGFRTVSTTIQRSARNLGIGGPRMVGQVLLPAALPHILSGMRMAWAFAWRTVVGAELVFGATGGSGGLGYFINQSRYYLDTASVFAGLVVISVLGLLIEIGFGRIERMTVARWGMTPGS
jgi:NitT/TauT family transport system permease protein